MRHQESPMLLGALDIQILHALARSETPDVGSAHRVRLEMMGLVGDSAGGLRLTSVGEKAALERPTSKVEQVAAVPRKLSSGGHKRNYRTLPMS